MDLTQVLTIVFMCASAEHSRAGSEGGTQALGKVNAYNGDKKAQDTPSETQQMRRHHRKTCQRPECKREFAAKCDTTCENNPANAKGLDETVVQILAFGMGLADGGQVDFCGEVN